MPDQKRRSDAGQAGPGGDRPDAPLPRLPKLVHAGAERKLASRLDDAQDEERPAKPPSEVDRRLGGRLGRRTEIGCEDDPRRTPRIRAHDGIGTRSRHGITAGGGITKGCGHECEHRLQMRPWAWATGTFRGAIGHVQVEKSCTLGAMTARTEPRQSRLDAFAALDAATRAIAALQPVDQVLQLIVDRVRPLVDAEYAAMGIVDPRGRIEQFVVSGIDDETRRLLGDPPQGHGLLGVIVREGRPLRIADISVHPDRYGFPAHHPPMTSLLGVPVMVSGQSVGNLYLTNKIGAAEFSSDDQRLVEAFAAHAGIAIQNARLHEQLHGLTVMEERERIGRDLHDGIIQAIYGIGLSLEDVPELMGEDPAEATRRVERAIDALHVAIRDLRSFVFGLRPELIEDSSLVSGLATLAEAFRHNTLIEPAVTWPEDLPEPPEIVTTQLLAIAGEALSNVARHARATAASIELVRAPGVYRLSIVDNGIGAADTAGRLPGHHGVANMRERATSLGGRIEISATPGGGTTVSVTVPEDPPSATMSQ